MYPNLTRLLTMSTGFNETCDGLSYIPAAGDDCKQCGTHKSKFTRSDGVWYCPGCNATQYAWFVADLEKEYQATVAKNPVTVFKK